jgi:autotransporter passenger strand-loop-strand repeat protein
VAPYLGGPLGGTAIDTTINNGGSQLVDNGGTARGTVVNSGGSLQVAFEGVASGATINGGGTEYVHSGGAAQDVAFGGTSATLDLESPTGLAGTISDWQVGDVIDFVGTSVTGAGISGSTLTITTSGGQSVSYQLAGRQPGTEAELQTDNHGGTDVVLEPTVTSVVAPPPSGIEHPGQIVAITVGLRRAVTVTGGTPTLTLNDGGLAYYNAAATAALGDPTKLVFSYTVGATAHEHNVGALTVQDASLNGALVLDASGNVPDFSALATAFANLQVVVAAPATVTSVVASPGSGIELPGQTVTITVGLSAAVTVTGGTPTLALNDGGTASYDAAATATLGDPTKLVFGYTVGATDQTVTTLGIVGGGFNGASITDAAGNVPDFSGVLTSFPGLGIDPPPAVTAADNQASPSGIDLTTISFGAATTLAYAPNQSNTGGSLTVSDGAPNVSIALLGQYMAGDFHAASDFHGGTLVTDPALTGAALATFVASPHA